jgi:HPt (histidine-containing phosphotransfer) domain-containing protein
MPTTFNSDELLASVDNDREFLADTVAMLADDAPGLIEQARTAAVSQDAGTVIEAAHTLKGMIANFRAEPARAVALELETLGKQDRLDAVPAACNRLEAEVNRLLAELRAFLES